MDAEKKVTQARTTLLLDKPWFGSLALRLHPVATTAIPMMGTDGTMLFYNPDWIEHTDSRVIIGTIAHEVLHCALLHVYRIGHRDTFRWNMACDYAINPLLIEDGFKLPDGILDDAQYHGMSAEQIYVKLPEPDPNRKPQPDFQPPQTPKPGDGPSQPGGPNPSSDPGDSGDGQGQGQGDGQDNDGDSSPEQMTAEDWQIATEQQTLAGNKGGTTPGFMRRELDRLRESRTDWRTILRRFVEQTIPSDYSWTNPNRRFVAQGMYLPGTIRENCPRLGMGVDTSGSISQQALAQVMGELNEIMSEVHPAGLDVVYADSRVTRIESFDPEDGPVELHPLGGGGTCFQPVFDYFNAQDEPPAAVLYFSEDLENSDRPVEPDYPVLWISGINARRTVPFGDHVKLEDF